MRLLRIELCCIRLANELQSCSKTKRKEIKNYRCYYINDTPFRSFARNEYSVVKS